MLMRCFLIIFTSITFVYGLDSGCSDVVEAINHSKALMEQFNRQSEFEKAVSEAKRVKRLLSDYKDYCDTSEDIAELVKEEQDELDREIVIMTKKHDLQRIIQKDQQ